MAARQGAASLRRNCRDTSAPQNQPLSDHGNGEGRATVQARRTAAPPRELHQKTEAAKLTIRYGRRISFAVVVGRSIDACSHRQSVRRDCAAGCADPAAGLEQRSGEPLGFTAAGGVGASAQVWGVSVVLSRVPSLVLFVGGIILERWDLAGEETSVLGIPVDRFE